MLYVCLVGVGNGAVLYALYLIAEMIVEWIHGSS